MESLKTARLNALTASFNARIEGMKADNAQRERQGLSVAWDDTAFSSLEDEFSKNVVRIQAEPSDERLAIATAAMQALISSLPPSVIEEVLNGTRGGRSVSGAAFMYADAMIEASKE